MSQDGRHLDSAMDFLCGAEELLENPILLGEDDWEHKHLSDDERDRILRTGLFSQDDVHELERCQYCGTTFFVYAYLRSPCATAGAKQLAERVQSAAGEPHQCHPSFAHLYSVIRGKCARWRAEAVLEHATDCDFCELVFHILARTLILERRQGHQKISALDRQFALAERASRLVTS